MTPNMRSLRLLCLPFIHRPDAIPEALRDDIFFEYHRSQWKDVLFDIDRHPQRKRFKRVLRQMLETPSDLPSLQCVVCGVIDADCSCHLIPI